MTNTASRAGRLCSGLVLALAFALAEPGCSTPAETIGQLPGDSTGAHGSDASSTTTPATAGSGSTASDDTAPASTGTTNDPAGPVLRLHVRATAEPWPHTDAFAGQTPRAYSAGIRSLTLIDTSGTHDDLVVFDHAPAHVVAGFDDGDDTIVTERAVAELPAATFDRARVALSFVRFTVDATVHLGELSAAGEVEAAQVLADGTILDGETHDLGWWRWLFSAGVGGPFETGGDTGSPIDMLPRGGPLDMVVEDGETAVYFDVSVLVEPGVTQDVDAILEVNVHESFRWQDEARDPVYTPGVFDARPPAFEPIRKLGVNAWVLAFGG